MELRVTQEFDTWLTQLKDRQAKLRINQKLHECKLAGTIIGDTKQIAHKLYELRLHYGPGYRIYYTIRNGTLVILLCGGDKSSQQKDINRAKKMIGELE